MRAVVQRVSKASVSVGDRTAIYCFLVSSIGRGICVLLGISREDTLEDVDYVVKKLLNVRLFDNVDTGKRWDKSVKDLSLEILSVSQFTLHVSFKGNKLDFHRAMSPQEALTMYNTVVNKLRDNYNFEKVKDCEFGSYMSVAIENDGPVTFTIDSKNRE